MTLAQDPKINHQTTALSSLAHELFLMAGKLSRGEIDPLEAVPLMTDAGHHIVRMETSLAQIGQTIEIARHNAMVHAADRRK